MSIFKKCDRGKEKILLRLRFFGIKTQILTFTVMMVSGLLWVSHRNMPVPPPPEPPRVTQLHEKTIATDLKIDDYAWGKKTFSIQIEKLRVVKKKMEFFRLGFFKIARVEGVTLNWYENSSQTRASLTNPMEDSKNQDRSQRLSDLLNKLKKYLPGNIRDVELTRVKMIFFQDEKTISTIYSDLASPGLQGQGIVFTGNVRIITESNKKLKCGKLTWLTADKKLISAESFIFEDSGLKTQGKGFRTDLELNKIISQERKKQ
ncbi:MAG: LPS export ABC transporter periplasmic protein LptC [Proteobacteria bacterium]|nr:LPS export ABC transporter periplasmic protein LptC [Pseudomonadota bacterium]MBU1389224.1 LPS export ABC transporter periplasmic protein LptC [Pseudomonadota bacterium]MBU1544788.1 LPS export ABC transporter periplasmic protein LptC [Pseudomonadota bacterium]MBU2431808.1 LPS export ABC transporter periplasmic protein LptC [Pseudomonadota bacterium]MBU2481892.1 LPS export ABC transporter periplasmic protein LptC [Pseudomonadota bacterium]